MLKKLLADYPDFLKGSFPELLWYYRVTNSTLHVSASRREENRSSTAMPAAGVNAALILSNHKNLSH
ncbi:hypothetical protein LC653_37895 [Nostoc sp. CHAB 5784]|uniref:hypothetical protein n=1 Tax=Nostoc mirabile TaxID=2907820 RepID=UPI001E431562|nr:hypothetical protein [Nostoc mirabile]MCC5669456.1 hypothetical protein [Nostoc mirabile CHAB5784]